MVTRVQIPAYCDRWMMGDRFGEIVKITKAHRAKRRDPRETEEYEVAHVKLDKSGKIARVVLDDCDPV